MTTSETLPLAISLVATAFSVRNFARALTAASVRRSAEAQSESSSRLFRQIISATWRRGGTWERVSLIFACDLMDTAWLGGKV